MASALETWEQVLHEERLRQLGEEPKPQEEPSESPQDDTQAAPASDTTPEEQEPTQEQEQPTEETPSTDQQSSTFLIDTIKQFFGVDLADKYQSDAEALEGLVNAYRLVGKRNRDAQVLAQLRAKYGDEGLQALLQGEPPQTTPRQPPAQTQAESETVEFDPTWLAMVERDETGNLRPRPGAPPDVVDKLVKFARHRDSLLNEFAKNPKQFVANLVQDIVQQNINQTLQQYTIQQQQEATLAQWYQQNAHLLFRQDNPTELTPLGKKAVEWAAFLIQHGYPDQRHAIMLGGEIVKAMAQMQPKQTQKPPPSAVHAPPKKTKRETLTLEEIIQNWDTQKQGPIPSLTTLIQMVSKQQKT